MTFTTVIKGQVSSRNRVDGAMLDGKTWKEASYVEPISIDEKSGYSGRAADDKRFDKKLMSFPATWAKAKSQPKFSEDEQADLDALIAELGDGESVLKVSG